MDGWGDLIERLPAAEAVSLVDDLNDVSQLLILAERVVVTANARGAAAAEHLVRRLRALGLSVHRLDAPHRTRLDPADTVLAIADDDGAPAWPDHHLDPTRRPVLIMITSAPAPCALAAHSDVSLRLPDLDPADTHHPPATGRLPFAAGALACADAVARNIDARLSLIAVPPVLPHPSTGGR